MSEFINNIFKKYNIYKPKNIILCISVLILIQTFISHLFFYKIENFTGDNTDHEKSFKWTEKLLFDFLTIQKLINPGIVFDTNIIQKQVTPNEMKFFFKNNYFYWSEATKEKYIHFINHNPSIRIISQDALNKSQTIYNETAILQLLYTQSKEGKFLIYGGKTMSNAKNDPDYGYNSGLRGGRERILCGENKNKEFILQKIVTKSNNFGINETSVTDLNNNELENEILGFKFLKNKCNPCLNLINNTKCEFLLL